MEWWYKSTRHKVTVDSTIIMQDAVKTVLREGMSLATVNLYDDKKYFYIKTTNKILLNHFLFQNGFEELEEDKTASELNLLY